MLMMFIWYESQIDEAYSILWRTGDVYARGVMDEGANLRLRLAKPRVVYLFLTTLLIWLDQETPDEMFKPKYL